MKHMFFAFLAGTVLASFLGLMLGIASPVQANGVELQVVPSTPFPGEKIGIPLQGEFCGRPEVVLDAAPEVRLVNRWEFDDPRENYYSYELTYTLEIRGEVLCVGVPPPSPATFAMIGDLPVGRHEFAVTGVFEDKAYFNYSKMFRVDADAYPRLDMSGAWHAPEQSGRGHSVIHGDGLLVVYWVTHDVEGEPTWLLLATTERSGSRYSGPLVKTSGDAFSTGAAQLEQEIWGHATFTYIGCEKARWTWEAVDESISSGELELRQLLRHAGTVSCRPEDHGEVIEVEWIDE